MYTNGLKDRFGSPLISINYADDRYAIQEENDFQHESIEQKIVEVKKSLQFLNDNFYELKDEVHNDKITSDDDETQHYHEQVSATNATYEGESSGFKIAALNLPNDWSIEKIEIPVLNTVTVEHYLGAYIVTGDTKEAILSDNATAWTSGTTATWTFNNNPITVPLGSSLELYIITSADGLGETEGTRSNYKIKTYYNSNGSGFMRYNGLWYGDRDVLCTFSCGIKLKELKSSVDQLQSTTEELSSILSKTNDGKIDPLISRLSTYNRYETNYFSTNIEGANCLVSSFRFGYKHFPHGLVKRISLYGRDAITSNIPEAHTTGCYLMANVYKKDGTLVSSTSSTNKLVVQFRPNSSTVVLNTWEFDNLVTPKEDEIIKFIPSPDGVTQVANYNLGFLVDNYHTHEDCMCGGDGDFANNPLASGSKWLAIAIIEGDFIHDNEGQNHFTDSTKHLNSVEKGVIESLYTPTNVLAWDNNYNNETLGVASMKGFIISRPYITNGKFKEIRWTSQGTATNAAVYMKITLRDTNGAPIKSYVSNNTQNFSVAGLKSYTFNEEWEVDDSVSSISFEPCTGDGTIRTDVQIRTRVIGNGSDNDSDGSESTNANYKINVQFYKIGSVTNKFTSHVGDNTHLTETDRNLLSDLANNGSKSYDWTPSNSLKITLDLGAGADVVAPCNGWFIKNPSTSDGSSSWSISLNGQQMFNSDRNGDMSVQLLLSEGSVLNSSVSTTGYFIPCTSEEDDWRDGETKAAYDIWKNAVVNDNGNYIVRNQYVPDASGWNSAWKSTFQYQLNNVTNDEGRTGGNGHLFYIQGENIENGSNLFNGMLLSQIKEDFPNMTNGLAMCKGTSNLHTFTGNLDSLENGNQMFMNCSKLTTFNGDESGNSVNLGELLNGPQMFQGASLLTTFTSPLSKLINSNQMFDGAKLTSWTVDMPELKTGSTMFRSNTTMTSFSSSTPKLQTGESMFNGCTQLQSWNGDLSALMTGYNMFYNTKLNATSVANIANTIKDISAIDKTTSSNWSITTSYNYDTKTELKSTISDSRRGRIDIYVDSSIVEDAGVQESCSIISDKGWSVYLNGTLMKFFALSNVYDTSWSVNSNVNSLSNSSAQQITKIVDNNVYDGDTLLRTMPTALETVTDVSGGSGSGMFYKTALTTFDSDLSSLENGSKMFRGTALTSFNSDLSSLTNGRSMFNGNALTSFNSELPSLTDGGWMFNGCTVLASFTSDLSSLTYGESMFSYCYSLESFNSDLSSLTNGYLMFYGTALESFDSNLSSLTNGRYMFRGCTALTTFDSKLPKLTSGEGMFLNCKLNTASVKNIADTINTVSSGTIHIGISNSTPSVEEQIQLSRIIDKGWTISVNGSSFNRFSHNLLKYNTYTTYAKLKETYPNYINDIDDSNSNYSWNYYLDNLVDGQFMFKFKPIKSFNVSLSSLTDGECMFQYTALETFNGDLSSLTYGEWMFRYAPLTSFDSDLPSLTIGERMFYGTALTSFTSDVSSLTNGTEMFYAAALTSFDSDLPSLTNGYGMFRNSGIESFTVDLPKLIDGSLMFSSTQAKHWENHNLKIVNGEIYMDAKKTNYSNGLTYFNSDLSALKSGYHMFGDGTEQTISYTDDNGNTVTETTYNISPLDIDSISNIADKIGIISELDKDNPTDWEYVYHDSSGNECTGTIVSSRRGVIHLGWDGEGNPWLLDQHCNQIANKGWTVYLNGTQQTPNNGAIETTDLTGDETELSSIPFYAKSIQVTEDEAEYVDNNNNYYVIVGAQHVFGDDLSTYGQYTSYEHAVEEISLSLGLTHKEDVEE